MKSSIFSTAWELFKSGIFGTFGAALKAAWTKAKLVQALKKGVAYFTFRKADGTERKAIGTLHGANYQYEAKGSQHTSQKAGLVRYWDLEKRAWRCLNIDTFIAFC